MSKSAEIKSVLENASGRVLETLGAVEALIDIDAIFKCSEGRYRPGKFIFNFCGEDYCLTENGEEILNNIGTGIYKFNENSVDCIALIYGHFVRQQKNLEAGSGEADIRMVGAALEEIAAEEARVRKYLSDEWSRKKSEAEEGWKDAVNWLFDD